MYVEKLQMTLAEAIMKYEDGQLSIYEEIMLFAYLIATGMAWRLQGCYGRSAMSYIEGGIINSDGSVSEEELLKHQLEGETA